MHFHEHKEGGELVQADPRPPEISPIIKRFYQYPVIGRLIRFLAWWLIFSGIYASSSVCPFCGQMGCPVGAGSAGLVGGFFALLIGKGKVWGQRGSGWFSPARALIKPPREAGP